ncbi:MAG: alpha/beta hydrolase [Magnetococcales bacterium]|nr:alpha/beta hydrolase [Magnetococcales bacterium]
MPVLFSLRKLHLPVWLLCQFLSACHSRHELAHQVADSAQLAAQIIQTTPFAVQSFVRLTPGYPLLTVYLEGDGLAWITPTRLSDDPTPKNPLALLLAAQDRSPSVAYLARPCQYVRKEVADPCAPRYWSNARYAPEVVEALAQAIRRLLQQAGATRLRLVGYSGGGTLALLLAPTLQPEHVVTVAAVLDTEAWTGHHQLSPLNLSLNPSSRLGEITHIQQTHWLGGQDAVVPKQLSYQALSALPHLRHQSLREVGAFTHHCCWSDHWPSLLQQMQWYADDER